MFSVPIHIHPDFILVEHIAAYLLSFRLWSSVRGALLSSTIFMTNAQERCEGGRWKAGNSVVTAGRRFLILSDLAHI